ncbi:MAG: prolipoprotein diacylglyceryl transferase [Eubacteriales bacterium]|nr:prolipoprotein diacylglyceryl transferase [Christensenellaceae bacterium]MDY3975273.1 prolipoprotein diacylglyceryl transferase [Eubacteriales bacterium]
MTSWMHENTLVLLLAVGTIFNIVWLTIQRNRVHIKTVGTIIISILHTLIGVGCVMVFALAEKGFDKSALGNMSLFGGVFFMPLFYFIFAKLTKRNMADVFDVFTVCIVFTLMCARVNCILSGCCLGALINSSGVRWPTREAEVLFYAVLFIVLVIKLKRGKYIRGTLYPLYMLAYGIFRFICEWFRVAEGSSLLHLGHVWAVISIAIGLSVYLELKNRENKKRGMRK